MSRRQRSSANGDADFKSYRDSAPANIEDSKIRKLMKEQNNNKEKINAAISGWWDSEVVAEPEESWVTTTKEKKVVNKYNNNSNSNNSFNDRNGGGGRGGARDFTAGGRGAGRGAGRGDRPERRSSSPRAAADTNDAAASTVPSDDAIPVIPTKEKNAAWAAKKDAKASESKVRKEKKEKEEKPAERVLPAPQLPADSIWNNVESFAQRIKRIEDEKNKPPPAPIVVEEEKPAATATATATEKPKKKRERKSKIEKKDKVVEEPVASDAPVVEETPVETVSVPVTEPTSSLLDDLTLNSSSAVPAEVPSSPVQSKSDADVEGSSKIGLKMGKWENKAERIEAPSLSFGSFGNASSSLVAEESSASWGAPAVPTSSDVPAAAVWSSGDQQSQAPSGEVAPPGLGSGKVSRSAPGGQSRKHDNQQNSQMMQGGYQQQPGFGGMPGNRGGAPASNMQMPYVQPGMEQQYIQPQFMAPNTAAPTPAVGSNVNSGSTLNSAPGAPGAPAPGANGAAPVAQPYAQQPPGMAAPYPYNQNPYYPQYGMQGMQQQYAYYGQQGMPPQLQYYQQQQGRGYANNRGAPGYDQQYNNAAGGDNGQFGNKQANKTGNAVGQETTDASASLQAAPAAPMQQYAGYMGAAPYAGGNPGAGQWGAYGQQQYGMQYPNGGQGNRDGRGYNNNQRGSGYNNNNNANTNNSNSDNNAQSGGGYWNK